ncbi:MAG: putative hydrolase or acyltransferase of alpha/beta superfamily [Acidimicrobiales bacterium]|nr:putative hydrolase or acyltransferase of alpha/beta superfamily [Acidimicrobiales bacterium]
MLLRTVQAGDVALEVAEAGAGDRLLLLVHGFTGAKEDFTEVVDRLAEGGWHVVAPDLRGHGNSDHPSGEDAYDLEIFADDLWALADVLGWERLVLLGHSMGGMVAQVAALRHPQRLEALVLMDTSCGAPERIDAGELDLGVAIVREHGMATLYELQSAREEEEVLATPASLRLLAERPGWEEFGRRKFMASAPEMWASMAPKMLSQADRIDALATLTMPVLVIVGEQDRPFLGPSERMAKAIPDARLVVVPDAGHSPQFENPDAWWDALTGFLQEVS